MLSSQERPQVPQVTFPGGSSPGSRTRTGKSSGTRGICMDVPRLTARTFQDVQGSVHDTRAPTLDRGGLARHLSRTDVDSRESLCCAHVESSTGASSREGRAPVPQPYLVCSSCSFSRQPETTATCGDLSRGVCVTVQGQAYLLVHDCPYPALMGT